VTAATWLLGMMYTRSQPPCRASGSWAHLHRSIFTALRCAVPSASVASATSIGPTSHAKKRGVILAFSSAPHREYGNARRNQAGTRGKPAMTASRCSAAVRPCAHAS